LALRGVVDGLVAKDSSSTMECLGFYVVACWTTRAAQSWLFLSFACVWRQLRGSLSLMLYRHLLDLPYHSQTSRSTGRIIQTISEGLNGLRSIVASVLFSIAPGFLQVITILCILLNIYQLKLLFAVFTFVVVCALAYHWGKQHEKEIRQ